MSKHIVIVGNGRLSKEYMPLILRSDLLIGVDRAAFWTIQHGKIPDVALGDFDSSSKEEVEVMKRKIKDIRVFPANKDWTDMELAVHVAIKLKPSKVSIVGGIGTRLDHTVGTIQLLEKLLDASIPHSLYDEHNMLQLIGRGRTILTKRGEDRYVSVIPITSTIQLSLSHFKYNITKKIIHRGQTISISNEFVEPTGRIYMHRGKALVIQCRD